MYNYKNKVSKIQILSLVTSFAIFVGGGFSNKVYASTNVDPSAIGKYTFDYNVYGFSYTRNVGEKVKYIEDEIHNLSATNADAMNDVITYSSYGNNGEVRINKKKKKQLKNCKRKR